MNEIVRIPVGPVHKNPAQMRRQYDLMKLAELTLQILSRGFDADRPLLVQKDGNGGYVNIRGHRRRMAYLMACHLTTGGEMEIEAVREQWESLVAQHNGDVEAAAESLVPQYGAQTVPAVIFQGETKQAVLSLWSDNFGGEPPDALGVAHSLLIGIRQFGILPEEAAAGMGQHRNYVENHLALAQVDSRIAERIARKDISMTVAVILMSLPADKREAMTEFLMSLPDEAITVAKLKVAARLLKELSFDLPLSFPHATRRNVARAFVRLWHEQVAAAPQRAYLAACAVLYNRQSYGEPWADVELIKEWLRALGVLAVGQNWGEVLEPHLTEVSCATCPIRNLPPRRLNVDLQTLPCRGGYSVNRCLHGLAPDDPFHVRVPMPWAGQPGVKGESGNYYVDSFDDLMAAYAAQVAAEETPVVPPAAPPAKPAPAPAKSAGKGKAAPPPAKAAAKAAPAKPADPDPTPAPPAGPSPLELMRARIGFYVDAHSGMNVTHFVASRCAGCQHHLDKSPTSDPSVPHCAWATSHRPVAFGQIVPVNDGDFEPIPVCEQYGPERPWHEIIPEHPAGSSLPRQWMVNYLLELVKPGSQLDGYKPFQWLTGRPMRSGEDYDRWFADQFATQQGNLSDAQVMTLFVMAHDEWKRTRKYDDQSFFIPVGGAFQMVPAKREAWEIGQ